MYDKVVWIEYGVVKIYEKDICDEYLKFILSEKESK